MTEQKMSFELWIEELKKVMRKEHFHASAIQDLDAEAYREYYNQGLTPAKAFNEDMSYGV